MEKVTAPHSSTLAWRIPWTEEPDELQSMGLLRVGHDWATSLSLFTFMHRRRKWQPTPAFLPGESQGWGSLLLCHLCVAQSRTRLKRLSSSSSMHKSRVLFSLLLLLLLIRIICWRSSTILCTEEQNVSHQLRKHIHLNMLSLKYECPWKGGR